MLRPGVEVWCDDQRMVLIELKSLKEVILKNSDGEQVTRLVSDIKLHKKSASNRQGDLIAIDKEKLIHAWEIARQMKELLAIPDSKRTAADVQKVAKFLETSRATIYRWMENYRSTGAVTSLLRKSRNDIGSHRLNERVEQIVQSGITKYLSENRPTLISVSNGIKEECKKQNLPPPDPGTVRSRINALDPKVVAAARYGKKYADERFNPLVGSFPNANYPLAVVQIDHTPMDVIVVDEIWRKPIQRPYLTIAIDVYSRMIVGFYISLDPPGALATGQCISSAILGKEKYLERLGVSDLSWDCWGKMRTIHTDNAKDFRGSMMAWAAKEHGINIEFRPKGQPRYGGTVERGFRTFMARVHEDLPGTTFSNVQARVDYDSEGKACMTIDAIEQWFTMYLLGVYHQAPHKGINNLAPALVWERALLEGTDEMPPTGLPARVEDEEQLRLDFMPYMERTVQEYGIQSWGITWYSDSIRRFMHKKKAGDIKNKKQFICRYDARDLSRIWFYDDITKIYIEVPYRDRTKPPVSLWEVRKAKRINKDESRSTTNEELIFQTIARMRKLVVEESELSKVARREQQRQKQSERTSKKNPAKVKPKPTPTTSPEDDDDFVEMPFDDIRES